MVALGSARPGLRLAFGDVVAGGGAVVCDGQDVEVEVDVDVEVDVEVEVEVEVGPSQPAEADVLSTCSYPVTLTLLTRSTPAGGVVVACLIGGRLKIGVMPAHLVDERLQGVRQGGLWQVNRREAGCAVHP